MIDMINGIVQSVTSARAPTSTSTTTSTSTSAQPSDVSTQKCSICLDTFEPKDLAAQHCPNQTDPGHTPVCQGCMEGYIGSKIEGAYMGSCPIIYCPCVHEDKKQRILTYPNWTDYLTAEQRGKHEKMAENLLAFFCGGCDTLRSLLVKYTEKEHDRAAATLGRDLSGEVFEELQQKLRGYTAGVVTTDELYAFIGERCYPDGFATTATDDAAWTTMKHFLLCVRDPERRANLQLRHIRARPHIWTPCCNRSHCYRCQTKDYHNGRTCAENLHAAGSRYDNSTIPCPQCNIMLAKGDGCSAVTCVCGKTFDWRAEKQAIDNCNSFISAHPQGTTDVCADVLCQTAAGSLQNARAWQHRHAAEVSQALMRWWRRQYPACPVQASAFLKESLDRTGNNGSGRVINISEGKGVVAAIHINRGAMEAATHIRACHREEAAKCERDMSLALDAYFPSLFPEADRAYAAVRVLSNQGGTFRASAVLGDRDMSRVMLYEGATHYSRLLKSASRWAVAHKAEYAAAKYALECRSLYQFMLTNGSKSIVYCNANRPSAGCSGVGMNLASGFGNVQYDVGMFSFAKRWDRGASDRYLEYNADESSVKRPGSSSCYPAALANLPSSLSAIQIVLTDAPRSMNSLSFGIAYQGLGQGRPDSHPKFPTSSSSGVGRTSYSCGIIDERGPSRARSNRREKPDCTNSSTVCMRGSSSSDSENVPFRKLRRGDVLRGVANTDEGWFDLFVEPAEGQGELAPESESDNMALEGQRLFDLPESIYHRFTIPVGPPSAFAFVCTLANDHTMQIADPTMGLSRQAVGTPSSRASVDPSAAVPADGSRLECRTPPAVAEPPALSKYPNHCFLPSGPQSMVLQRSYAALLSATLEISSFPESLPSSSTGAAGQGRLSAGGLGPQSLLPLEVWMNEAMAAVKTAAGSNSSQNAAAAPVTHAQVLNQHGDLLNALGQHWVTACSLHMSTSAQNGGSSPSLKSLTARAVQIAEAYVNHRSLADFDDDCLDDKMVQSAAAQSAPATPSSVAATPAGSPGLTDACVPPAGPASTLFTWFNVLAAVCYHSSVRAAEEAENTALYAELFLQENGTSAPMMAASICCTSDQVLGLYCFDCHEGSGGGSGSSSSYRQPAPTDHSVQCAQAFMAAYPYDMQEFYEDNLACQDPLITTAGAVKGCRCLPRHYNNRYNSEGGRSVKGMGRLGALAASVCSTSRR